MNNNKHANWLVENANMILRDARKEVGRVVQQPARRAFLQRTLTLGGLSLLSGCALVDGESIDTALMGISRLNDKAQGWLFDPNRLAPTYPDSMITRPFPFNAFYGEGDVREVEEAGYRLEVTGQVADRKTWSLEPRFSIRAFSRRIDW